MKKAIQTSNAPAAIGCYSQAIQVGNNIFLSGQIPLDPKTMTLVEGDIDKQIIQVFENLKAVTAAVGRNLDEIVKLTVFLTDIAHLANVNSIMPSFFNMPYPARTSIVVAGLPKGAQIEIEGVI
jgi:reactive intermediate/imine deaminase